MVIHHLLFDTAHMIIFKIKVEFTSLDSFIAFKGMQKINCNSRSFRL
jgi:hypothetical protein